MKTNLSNSYIGFSTQQELHLTRTLGTIYQNTNVRPMLVIITCDLPLTASCIVYSDSNANPTTPMCNMYNNAGVQTSATSSFIVLPGNYYQANGFNAASMVIWVEML